MIQRAAPKADRGAKGATRAESPVRVAVYVRKSTSDGLDQRLTSLQAQEEAIRSYVASRRGEGWVPLPELYEDAGFTGSNTERPAFQRMMGDVEAGKIDVVAVHRLDRFSRSVLDFVQTTDHFLQHNVQFVSVTESIDTSTAFGEMMLQVLAIFAQFERRRIVERTREKLAAQRRKGLWTGGRPLLGYDVANRQLVVNREEAERVRQIFQLYLERGSQLAVALECNRRGWTNKAYTCQDGRHRAGKPFTRLAIQKLLKKPQYVGKLRVDGELIDAAHEAIVDPATWEAVQALARQHTPLMTSAPKRWDALLRGLLRCEVCGAAMCHEIGNRRKGRRYRYYVCESIRQRGAPACPGSRVPAGEIEAFVAGKIREVGRDPAILAAVVEAAEAASADQQPDHATELQRLQAERRRLLDQQARLVDAIGDGEGAPRALLRKLGAAEERVAEIDAEIARLHAELAAARDGRLDPDEVRRALEGFDEVWDVLAPHERARVLRLLIQEIAYNSKTREVAITFRANGIRTLGEERHGKQAAHDPVSV